MHNLNENMYVEKLNDFGTALAVQDYPASGSFIDMSNYWRGAFLIFMGTFDSDVTCQVQQATTVSGTPKNLTGATKTFTNTTDDNKWSSIEFGAEDLDLENGYRFVTLDVTGPAGGNDYACIVFVAWDVRHRPVTQPTNYLTAVRIPTGS